MGGGTLILLDTHIWIWWVSSPQRLSPKAAEQIRKGEKDAAIGISIISCWEIGMLVAKGRVGFSLDLEEWIEKSLRLPQVKLLELTPKIAVLSSRLQGNPPADPADRILIATAKAHGIPLVTKDEEIQDYPHVESIW